MRDNTIPPKLLHRPEKPLSPPASIEHTTPTKELARLAISDAAPTKTTDKASSITPATTTKPTQSAIGIAGIGLEHCELFFEPPESEMSVVYPYRGHCMVYSDRKDFSVRFAAKFAIELHLETAPEPNMAFLHLETDGIENRVHNIFHIDLPRMTVDGAMCILRNKVGANFKFCYYLGLKDQETTTQFVEAIEGVQKAVEAVANGQGTTATETMNNTAAPLSFAESLVNLEPEPRPDNSDTLRAIVEGAITAIHSKNNLVLSAVGGHHVRGNGINFDDLSQNMYSDWKDRANISRFPDMLDNFRELLYVLFRISSILDHASDGDDRPLISEATMSLLKHLESNTSEAIKPMRYNADEMVRYRCGAVDVSGVLKPKTFLPPRTPSISTKKAELQSIFYGTFATQSKAHTPNISSITSPSKCKVHHLCAESTNTYRRHVRFGEW